MGAEFQFSRPIVWHVLFSPEKRWWSGRFCHVALAGYAEDNWLHLDLHRTGVNASVIYKFDDVQDYLSTLLSHFVVVRMPDVVDPKPYFWRPMTCVGFVKHTLGVRCSALRPDGLFQTLVHEYGAEVLNESPENRGNG